jgi:hypothetical protein
MAAHDEELYPGSFPLVVLNAEAAATYVIGLNLSSPLHSFPEVEDLARLAQVALTWTNTAFEEAAASVKHFVNGLPEATRRKIRLSEELKININEENRHKGHSR